MSIAIIRVSAVLVFSAYVMLVAANPASTASADNGEPPEPAGLWQGHMHGDTPASVAGATVIGAGKLAELQGRDAVLIDVAHPDSPAERDGSNRPHASIPGATWMPGAGSGTSDAQFAALFAKRLAELTGGDKDKPIVAFCHPRRWGSWNAAKRAAMLGYRHVYWLPTGSEAWRATHKPDYVREDPDWKAGFGPIKDRAPSLP